MKKLLLAWLFVLLAPCASRADDWQHADVYFIEWDVSTRARLTPQDVRQRADYKQTFRDNAHRVREVLQLHRLKRSKDKRPEDARVVIDYIDDDLSRHTIYISRFHLFLGGAGAKFAIDEEYRQRISRLAKWRRFR